MIANGLTCMASGNRRLASLGQRAIALILDGFLVGIAMAILFFVVAAGALSSGNASVVVLFPVIGIAGSLYWVVFEGLWGTTVGKKLIGLKVVDERGSPPGIVKALIRNILRIVDALPTLYIIGILLIYTNDDNQRLGDMIGDTYVVRS